MTAVPLYCYICPQEPAFSDLSHLLTHVSSKGHLAHYHKAQLRGRGEPEIRQKLDKYDQWYKDHQIEQLLAERLSAKASKPDLETGKKPSKAGRPPKRRIKKAATPQPSTPVKAELAIDPELAHPQAPPQYAIQDHLHLNGLNTGETRLHVPYMSELQYRQAQMQLASQAMSYSGSNSNIERSIAGSHSGNDADVSLENDYFKAFVRSPTRSVDMDSPELSFSLPVNRLSPARGISGSSHRPSDDQDKEGTQGNADSINSPILKGVKWPGMSLFDSACADAQRLRNQKKDGSIIQRMAQNSSVVEQMEYIYWPDGSLKKSQFITGNVESSPSSTASPVLKPARRPRTIKPRPILADKDANELMIPKKTQRKSKTARSSLNLKEGKNVSESRADDAIVTPETARPTKRKAAIGQNLAAESPSVRPRRNVNVLQDIERGKPSVDLNRASHLRDPYESDIHPVVTGYRRALTHSLLPSVDWFNQNQLRSYPKTPNGLVAPKSLSTDFESQAFGAPTKEPVGRITQRYFSVTGNEEPQFFASMPPQMEFGGMAGPKYRGATLNPLNPYLRQARHHSSHL